MNKLINETTYHGFQGEGGKQNFGQGHSEAYLNSDSTFHSEASVVSSRAPFAQSQLAFVRRVC